MTIIEFLRIMPSSWPEPDPHPVIEKHDEGYNYTVDWDLGKGKMVSITIDLDGDMIWAALVNGKSLYGSMKNPKDIPFDLFIIFRELGYE